MNTRIINGMTALMFAASHKDVFAVKLLLDAKADVNCVNSFGEPLLIHIIKSQEDCRFLPTIEQNSWADKLDLIYLLIIAGANVNQLSSKGESALATLEKFPLEGAAELLQKRDCTPHATSFPYFLSFLIEKSYTQLTTSITGSSPLAPWKSIIKAQRKIRHPIYFYELLLFVNPPMASHEIVDSLIKAKVDLNTGYKEKNETLLHYVSKKGHVEMVKALLEKKVDIDSSYTYMTPLTVAAVKNNRDCVELLILAKADSDPGLEQGYTTFAKHFSQIPPPPFPLFDCGRLLLKQGLNLHYYYQFLVEYLVDAQSWLALALMLDYEIRIDSPKYLFDKLQVFKTIETDVAAQICLDSLCQQQIRLKDTTPDFKDQRLNIPQLLKCRNQHNDLLPVCEVEKKLTDFIAESTSHIFPKVINQLIATYNPPRFGFFGVPQKAKEPYSSRRDKVSKRINI